MSERPTGPRPTPPPPPPARRPFVVEIRTARPPYDVDPRVPDDDIYVEPYEADPFPVSWDFLAIVVIAAAAVAFGWWAFLR